MDINEIRRRNYDALMEQFRQKEIAKGEPDRGMLNRFGAFIGVSPRYLSHVRNNRKQVGGDTARKIELAFKLPHGWMDSDHVGGVDPSTRAEREFLDLALQLFRQNPVEAQSALIRFMSDRLLERAAAPRRRAL